MLTHQFVSGIQLWSWLSKIDDDDLVIEVKEKEAISNIATVGIYFYTKGEDFVNASIDMIIDNDRTNNEFYTCQTYNYAIREGKKFGIFNIEFDKMHGIGTTEDLNTFLKFRFNV